MKKGEISLFHAILLMIQMVVILVGLLIQTFLFVYLVRYQINGYMIASAAMVLLTYIAIILYSSIGFKRTKVYYIVALCTFLVAILMNIILPFRDVFSRTLLVLLFGLFVCFLVRQENYKATNILLFVALIISLTFSIYSAITANVNNVPNANDHELAVIMMYLSIFAPFILTALFNVIYLVRKEKEKNMVQ